MQLLLHDTGPSSAAAALALVGTGAPKSIRVIRYGRDGVSVATTGQGTYGSGTNGGAQLSYASKLAGGAPHASSAIAIDAAGRAVSADTQLLNPDGSLRKKVSADYSKLVLSPAGVPSSGLASFSVSAPDGTPTHQGQMSYAGERFDTYAVDSLAQGDITAAGRTEIDFAKAFQVGTRLVGGVLALSHAKNGGVATTRSRSVLSQIGLPSQLIVSNFDVDGVTCLQLVESDYQGIAFDPRGRINSGKLLVRTKTPAGVQQSASVFTYSNGKLVTVLPLQPGQVIAPIAAAQLTTVPGPWTPNRPPDRSRDITRADGSLAARRQDWLAAANVPYRTLVTRFALDGRTTVSVTDIDYRGASFDPNGNAAGGTVLSTLYEAGTRASTTQINY